MREIRTRRWMLVLSVIWGLMGLTWILWGQTEQVAVGEGVVVPASSLIAVTAQPSGLVKRVLVHMGDRVHQGETLLILDAEALETARQGVMFEQAKTWAALERLRALIQHQPLVFPSWLRKQIPQQLRVEKERHQKSKAQESTLLHLEQHSTLVTRQDLLSLKGLNPKALQWLLDWEHRGQFDHVKQALHQHIVEQRAQWKKRLETLEWQAVQQRHRLQALERQLSQTQVRSPCSGVVQKINVRMGEQTQSRQTLLILLPAQEGLMVEATFTPAQRAMMHVGQMARLSVLGMSDVLPIHARVIKLPTLPSKEHGVWGYRVRLEALATSFTYRAVRAGNTPLALVPGLPIRAQVVLGVIPVWRIWV